MKMLERILLDVMLLWWVCSIVCWDNGLMWVMKRSNADGY